MDIILEINIQSHHTTLIQLGNIMVLMSEKEVNVHLKIIEMVDLMLSVFTIETDKKMRTK